MFLRSRNDRCTVTRMKRRRKIHIRVGYALARYLIKNRMTQTELAAKLGVDGASVSRYLSGGQTPTATVLVRMQRELGISLDDLVRR